MRTGLTLLCLLLVASCEQKSPSPATIIARGFDMCGASGRLPLSASPENLAELLGDRFQFCQWSDAKELRFLLVDIGRFSDGKDRLCESGQGLQAEVIPYRDLERVCFDWAPEPGSIDTRKGSGAARGRRHCFRTSTNANESEVLAFVTSLQIRYGIAIEKVDLVSDMLFLHVEADKWPWETPVSETIVRLGHPEAVELSPVSCS
jgi:hypothetical protein